MRRRDVLKLTAGVTMFTTPHVARAQRELMNTMNCGSL